jgi:hypothetical protein
MPLQNTVTSDTAGVARTVSSESPTQMRSFAKTSPPHEEEMYTGNEDAPDELED